MQAFQSYCVSPYGSGGRFFEVHGPLPALVLTMTCWSNFKAAVRLAGVPWLPRAIFTSDAEPQGWMVVHPVPPVTDLTTPTPRRAA